MITVPHKRNVFKFAAVLFGTFHWKAGTWLFKGTAAFFVHHTEALSIMFYGFLGALAIARNISGAFTLFFGLFTRLGAGLTIKRAGVTTYWGRRKYTKYIENNSHSISVTIAPADRITHTPTESHAWTHMQARAHTHTHIHR